MAPGDKSSKFDHLPLSTSGPIECALTGTGLLNTPYLNKGSAFPEEERVQFDLTGLLPQSVQTLEQQTKRAWQQYSSRPDQLAKNTFLTSLKEQNEVLYFKARPPLHPQWNNLFGNLSELTGPSCCKTISKRFLA